MHRSDISAPEAPTRLAIVTGAGGGLGRAFCRALTAQGGWHIVAVDVDQQSLEEALADIGSEAPAATAAQAEVMDVADPTAWAALRDRLRAKWPRLDLLVNNAGVCLAAEAGQGPLDPWRRVMEVNYLGLLCGCHTMTAWLKESAAGRPAIVNVASIAGLLAGPSMGAYCASKAAVVALSEAMYAELRPAGVGVTVAAPGFFRTGLLERGEFCTPRHRAQAERLARHAAFTADDVARAVLRAAQRRQLYVVLGRRARWLWRLKRLAPRTLQRIVASRYHQTFGING